MTQQTAPATAEANGPGPVEQVVPHPDAGTGTLDERLARIVGTLKVTADAKMKAGGQGGREFSYATIDQMAGAIGPLLAAERVTIAPVGIEDLVERELVRQKDGGKGPYEQIRHMTSMTVVWRVAAAGESFEARSRGKSADPEGSEKDTNQAHSFARINLYKSLFHLVTGDDPERKSAGGSGGGVQGGEWTGELPNVDPGAGVTGDLALGTDGSVGIFFKAEDDGAFEAIKESVKGIPDRRWNADVKRWIVPAEEAGAAVVLARHIGLTIPDALSARFPVVSPEDSGLPGADDFRPEPAPDDLSDERYQRDADDIPF